MKQFLLIIFVFSFLCAIPVKVSATHAYGGNVTYKSIGNDSFLVTVKFYRDCSGVQFGISTSFRAVCATNTIGISYSVPTPIDVTPVCESSCTKCGNSGCSFPFGIQEYTITSTIYLGNYIICCNWMVEWNQCCRSSQITTGSANEGFVIQSQFNRCLSQPNSSPKTIKPSFEITCVGSCAELNFGMTDDDGDSLVYSLVSPLKTATQTITYSPGYDYDLPVYFFGFPNAQLSWNPISCRGFHLDPQTGILRFKPMLNQISTLAIKVEEYRNGTKIGEVINDIGIIAMTCSQGQPQIKISQTNTRCESDSLILHFTTSDPDTDQVFVSIANAPPGTTLNVDSNLFPSGTISYYIPDLGIQKDTFISMTIKIEDDGCPLKRNQYVPINVLVKKRPSGTFTATANNCGQVLFKGMPLDGDTSYSFVWHGTGGLNATGKEYIHSYTQNGKYHFTLDIVKDGCTQSYSDSVEINLDGDIVTTGLPHDTLICSNEKIIITPKKGSAPYNILILNDSSNFNLLSPISDTTFYVQVTDAKGCRITDTVNISVIPPVSISAGQDRHFCENAGLQTFSGSPSGGIFTGKGMLDSNRFDPSIAGNDIETIVYTFTDSNGCIYNDSFYVQVNDRPDIFLSNDTTVCIGEQLNLDASPTGGIWSGNGLMNNVFDAAIAGVGTHTLTYSYFVTPQCGNSDSFTVTVAPLPVVDAGTDTAICATAKPVLPVSPAGGTWDLPAFNNDTFAAIRAGAGLHTAVYSYTDSLGCTNADTVNIYVSFLQGVSAMADFKVCANERKLNLTGNPPGGKWHGAGVSGNEFNPAAVTAGNYILYYSYVDSTGCTGYDTTIATVAAPPVANFHANPIYGKAPLTVDLSDASTGAINHWQWTVGDTTLYGPSPSVTIADTGYHTITLAVTDSLTGCSDTFSRQAYIMVLTNGIFEMKESTFSVKVYPSPADNKCFLMVDDLEGMRFRFLLYNLQGNLVQAKDLSGISPYTIDREGLPAGVYLFELVSHKGHKASGKIIFR